GNQEQSRFHQGSHPGADGLQGLWPGRNGKGHDLDRSGGRKGASAPPPSRGTSRQRPEIHSHPRPRQGRCPSLASGWDVAAEKSPIAGVRWTPSESRNWTPSSPDPIRPEGPPATGRGESTALSVSPQK